jgi:predicted MPP superfamily phosphohydrolase
MNYCKMKRKTFIKSIAIMGGASLISGMYAWQVEPFWLEFVHKKMLVKNLGTKLKGKTLMQISDMHVGRCNQEFLIQSFKKANLYKPDIIVYTGDFVSYRSQHDLDELKDIAPYFVKGRLATLGILGNHDYGKNWANANAADQICDVLETNGVEILRNTKSIVEGLHIYGLDDKWGTNFNPEKCLESLDLKQSNLVLCHNPDVADLDVWNGYNDWILSGHTHGGQCRPPFLEPPIIPVLNRRYTAGEFALSNSRTMYINRALGHSNQVRFNVRPEITVFELG